jgi:glycosyltransferase involved in cell wall biosynthesis
MRVLHLVPSIGPRSGGLGQIAPGLAQAQRALGLETAVWCLDLPVETDQEVRQWSWDIPIIPNPTVGPSAVGLSPMAERTAVSEIGERYTILHQHGIWMANSRVTKKWRRVFQRPTVVAPQGALEERALRRSNWKKRLALLGYERDNLRSASCVQATSQAEAAGIRRFGLRSPIAVIPNGIPADWLGSTGDAKRFRHLHSIPEDKRLLLFLSRLHPIKGLPLLFEAMAPIRQQLTKWILVVAGPAEGSHRHELERLSERLWISDLVRFVGPLFNTEKRDAFAAAELFILPTQSESFAIAVAEALGAAVPVLTTHGAPWNELETRRCGWWTAISVTAIRDALLEATRRHPKELAEMGKRGQALVAEKYTWDQVARQSLLLYEWLLKKREQPDFVMVE